MFTHKPAGLRRRLVVWAVGLVLSAVATTSAQTLSVSGSPGRLRIHLATAGSPPTPASDATTTYTVKAKKATQPRKITAQINSNMPAGLTLTVTFTPVTGATGLGAITLTTTAQDVVTNIANTTNRSAAITYLFSATSAAALVATGTRNVTLTLIAAP